MTKSVTGGRDFDAEIAKAVEAVGDRAILWRQFPYLAEKFAALTKVAIDTRLSELVAKVTKLEGEIAVLRLQRSKK